jgi:Na+/alanine symporter
MRALDDLLLPFLSWVLLPIVVLGAIALTVILRAPQWSRLAEGWRGLRPDPAAPGQWTPAASVSLSIAATSGAGAVLGTATAISLGGLGAVAWLWLFALLVAPLRYGEAVLARSAPPGKAGVPHATGSLAARLSADAHPAVQRLGVAIGLLVPVAAFLVVGGLHGAPLGELAEAVAPGSGVPLAALVAAAGVALVLLPAARASIAWVGVAALAAVALALVVPILHDVGRGFSLFGRAIDDALHGAPSLGGFTGAVVAEVARAGIQHLFPSLVASVGADGGLHAEAQAASARAQAGAAVLGVFVHVLVVTLVGMAVAATGVFTRRTDDERRLSDVVWVDSAYETASQRLEDSRRWTGYLRVVDGAMSGDPRPVGLERSMAVNPRFEELDGTPADFALRIVNGRIGSMLRLDADGALVESPDDEPTRVRVVGDLLPRGAAMLLAATRRGGGEVAGRLLLAALLVLSALTVAGWGAAARQTLRRELAEGPARAGIGLAALGLVVGSSGIVPSLPLLGGWLAGLLAALATAGMIAKLVELDRILTPAKPAEPSPRSKTPNKRAR